MSSSNSSKHRRFDFQEECWKCKNSMKFILFVKMRNTTPIVTNPEICPSECLICGTPTAGLLFCTKEIENWIKEDPKKKRKNKIFNTDYLEKISVKSNEL